MVIPEGGYLNKFHYPLKVDGKAAVQIIYNLNLASAKAVKAYHDYCAENSIKDGRIGIVINLTPAYPRSEKPEDVAAAHFAEIFKNNAFLDPAVKGEFPEELVKILTDDGVIWESAPDELEIIKHNTVDYLGVNYIIQLGPRLERLSLIHLLAGCLRSILRIMSGQKPALTLIAAGKSILRPYMILPSIFEIIMAIFLGTFLRMAWV